ncbi:SMP-30/gluconolactonase/LRE family protein [Tianweitania sp. BSSL-BM11]|uniref:SMP-30/gluconolactonase/LRE family protein n=1 Tax=Tianweitania aestuarii TaxID=2814886 RepID=A0ABS5RYN3_9HYPH|nr:SMP-30/gluconolactonase/LRE family protein [Tianweitania aestuarii]MBS9722148.1 SMP-30/gluconolactonase/LRE family protein [Tianweitania aestuarii]
MIQAELYDDRPCRLGEGPLWHPERKQLFWFDILNHKMLTREGDEQREWQFDRAVSAAGWIDRDTLLVAGAGALLRFNLVSGRSEPIIELEGEQLDNRSNDGGTDPWGGFWIGTMGRKGEHKAGSIYRYYRGEVRQLVPDVTITNAISFKPDGSFAFFADTRQRLVWKQALDGEGWPKGEPSVFLDLSSESLNPDGAAVDAEGRLWVAQWGAGRVACYDDAGTLIEIVSTPATQSSCPAFGGADLSTLFITSARDNLDAEALASQPLAGSAFKADLGIRGQAAHRVIL